MRQPSADPPEEPPETPPSWVRWTTGTGLVIIVLVLLTPYAFWSRLAVLAALVATVGMLCGTDDM